MLSSALSSAISTKRSSRSSAIPLPVEDAKEYDFATEENFEFSYDRSPRS